MAYLTNEVCRGRGEKQKYFLQWKHIVHCSENYTQCVHFFNDLWIYPILQSSDTEVAECLLAAGTPKIKILQQKEMYVRQNVWRITRTILYEMNAVEVTHINMRTTV